MRRPQRSASARLLTFVSVVSVLGLGLATVSFQWWPIHADTTLMALLALVVFSELMAVSLPYGGTQSVSIPLVIAILLLHGAAAATVALVASGALADLRAHKEPIRVWFNIGQLSLAGVVAGGSFSLVSEGLGLASQVLTRVDDGIFPAVIVPGVSYSIVLFMLTTLLVSVAVSLSTGDKWSLVWKGSYSWQLATYVALTVMGLVLAKAIVLIGVAGIVLFAGPIFVARGVFQSYVRLVDAYADTVKGLVAVLEAKDKYTKGHSERVAHYATMTAKYLELDEETVSRIELAALLHDFGKIGIDSKVLRKDGRLSEEEIDAIRRHPTIATDILSDIPFLAPVLPAIHHHHERLDGAGYTEGLSGRDIPLEARILAVADAYDAMTTERPYRVRADESEAIAELRSCCGTQFDPEVVSAFERVLLDLNVSGIHKVRAGSRP
ncbi:MAG: HD-GYP domain-containing protein [Coriobacteriia bacterium]